MWERRGVRPPPPRLGRARGRDVGCACAAPSTPGRGRARGPVKQAAMWTRGKLLGGRPGPGREGTETEAEPGPPGWGLGHSRWSGDSGGEGRTAQGRGAGLRTPEPAGREHRSLQESPRRERRSPRSAVSLGPPGTTGCFVLFTP